MIERLVARLYGQPLLTNVIRGAVVEEIVAMALEPEWTLCSEDYAPHDLVHVASGLRVQVKNSAARQSWGVSVGSPRFSIEHKTGRHDGPQWIAEHGRNAEIFLFAWHPVYGDEADHRDPDQWRFYALAESDLPDQKSITLGPLARLTEPCAFAELHERMNVIVRACQV